MNSESSSQWYVSFWSWSGYHVLVQFEKNKTKKLQKSVFSLFVDVNFLPKLHFLNAYSEKTKSVTPIFYNRFRCTVDSRYLEFDGTMEKIRFNCSSTQEELRKYRKCSLFNDERETTRAKFWRVITSIACPYSRNDFKHIRCFCCCFFLC